MKAPCDATTGGGRDFCKPREEYGFVRARAIFCRPTERRRGGGGGGGGGVRKIHDRRWRDPVMRLTSRARLEQLTKRSRTYVTISRRIILFSPKLR